MIDPGPATLGLDIATASVSADPALLSADPAMMATAARAFSSAAHQIEATGRASAQASAQLSTTWWGKGKQGFDAAATKANADALVAADALAGASGALTTLSVQISAAQAMAHQAQGMAADSAQAGSVLQSAYAASAQLAVQALPAGATAEQVLAARAPTPAQGAQASAISADAAQATQLMSQANNLARQAWSQAANAFDAVTAQAPSVQSAVLAARAKAANAHQGGGILGGILNLGGAVLLGIVDGGTDVATDGAATGLDEADAGEISNLAESGVADLSGGASASGAAAAEEEAAANTVVDGERLGGQVAEDAAAGPGAESRGDVSPSTPTGQRGSPMEVPRGTNSPATIDGTSLSGHALDEMQSDGIPLSVVKNALEDGAPAASRGGTTVFYDAENNVSVVQSPRGNVITVSYGDLRP